MAHGLRYVHVFRNTSSHARKPLLNGASMIKSNPVSNWASGGVAKFCIDRYLKYAHLADAPELEVLGDTFELPLALSAAPAGVVASSRASPSS